MGIERTVQDAPRPERAQNRRDERNQFSLKFIYPPQSLSKIAIVLRQLGGYVKESSWLATACVSQASPRRKIRASVMALIWRISLRMESCAAPSTRTSETASAPRVASRLPKAKVAMLTPRRPSVLPT